MGHVEVLLPLGQPLVMSRGHLDNGSMGRNLDSIRGSGSDQSTLKHGTKEGHPGNKQSENNPWDRLGGVSA